MRVLEIPNLQKNILLAPFTTYKIGGPADYFIVAKSKAELVNAVTVARKNKIPYFILGTGANILIGDKGYRGLVIKNEANKVDFLESTHDSTITADSGMQISELIKITAEKNLSGLEHFAGIPSTVGGAIWQNLHFLTPDRNSTFFIESIFQSAEIMDENNKIFTAEKDFFKFGYDYSLLHDRNLLVLSATLKLKYKDHSLIEEQINENIKWRNERQPQLQEFPSCGSVFKKIESVGAGRLIDKVGLKGFRVGGAQISEKHANFIVNTGGATAYDIITIIKAVTEKVLNETGYKMETEISFIGEF